MFKLSLLFCVLILFVNVLNAQNTGCTDENALNFDENATQNDGSCEYDDVTYNPNFLSNLPDTVNETSGVIVLDNGIWTHNDSGNEPKLYLLDENSYELIRTVHIRDYPNVDWEEITHNEDYVFIGDFGNNNGGRTDLKILKFEKSLLLDNSIDTIDVSEVINFSYPDQTDFQHIDNEHNFDCEAFIYFNDSLQIFTKHRADEFTKHYTLPAEAGTYSAILKDSLEVFGQVTASHIQGDTLIALLGYRPSALFEPFVFLLWDFPSDQVFNGNKRRVSLGTVMEMGQNEAIYFTGNNQGYITAEEINQFDIPPKIFKFDFTHLFSDNIASTQKIDEEISVKVFPNPSNGILTITSDIKKINRLEIYNETGQLLSKTEFLSPKKSVTEDLDSSFGSTLILNIYLENDELIVRKIMLNK